MGFKLLSDIASVRSGHAFRTGVQHDPSGDLAIIQGRDVDASALCVTPSLDGWLLQKSDSVASGIDHRLQRGDVLVMARGASNYAVVIDGDLPHPTVAVSSFHIIKPNTALVNPLVLAWMLNQDSSQSYFRANNTGTTIPMINLDTLRALPLNLPPLQTQYALAEMIRLSQQERLLMNELAAQRQLLLRAWAAENV